MARFRSITMQLSRASEVSALARRTGLCVIRTINGAKSSAIIYSLVETAKANKLRLYEYFNYLLTEIPEHMDDKNNDFCEKLLPWSDELPAECRK